MTTIHESKQPRHQGPLLDTYKSFNCNRTFNDA